MSQAFILTGDYVRIYQTPASIGERMLAYLADLLCQAFILAAGSILIWSRANELFPSQTAAIYCFVLFFALPVACYPLICEAVNNGQTLGKRLMGIRVVSIEGVAPSLGAYVLRNLLLLIDGALFLGGLVGLLSILLTTNRQRIGDLAAGTLVVKEDNYRLGISLDEFSHLSPSYQPHYPQAADLTLDQIGLINRTLQLPSTKRSEHLRKLTQKVSEHLHIRPNETDELFLRTLLRDYQHYILEEV